MSRINFLKSDKTGKTKLRENNYLRNWINV